MSTFYLIAKQWRLLLGLEKQTILEYTMSHPALWVGH